MTDDAADHAPWAQHAQAYLGSLAMVVAAVLIGMVLHVYAVNNIALVFLTAVLASGVVYGRWPSIFACIASSAAYNFFFLPPLYTLSISDRDNVVALFFFFVVAIIAGNLTAQIRAQAVAERERARMTENLYLFSRKLAAVITLDDLLWVTAFQIAQMLKTRVIILLQESDQLELRAGYPPEDTLTASDRAAAQWVWTHAAPAGRDTNNQNISKYLFLPMRTGRGPIGVVGLDSDDGGPLQSEQRRLLDALTDQAALAIERIRLAEDMDRARLASETERLRGALLTSISHDLRTPLASILGSASSLSSYRKSLDDAAQQELIGTIQEEAERLNRFIANLLDMTRLESGAIEIQNSTTDVADVIGSALRRASTVLSQHKIELELGSDLPPAKADPVLFEQVLFNLLDNAAKYTAPGTKVHIEAHAQENALTLSIVDEGEGIPPSDLEKIFDKFYRVLASDRKRAGTGLGLAICRGFIEAMGGTQRAGNRTDRRGAIFTIIIPAAAKSELSEQTSA
jgi:two-component system, OmpR family, sensor histidine kinase KdpD